MKPKTEFWCRLAAMQEGYDEAIDRTQRGKIREF
jgi:hypothetical protein